MIEAGLGLRSATKWAAELERHPAYEVNASVIRMLDCLFQADLPGAEEQKRLADRLRIQNSGRQMYEMGVVDMLAPDERVLVAVSGGVPVRAATR